MSPNSNKADQELLGLLGELADQKERALLNASLTRLRKSVTQTVEPLSSRMAGLSSLERQLLDVYREDLGRLISATCLRLLVSSESLRGMVFTNCDRQGRRISPMDEVVWKQRCQTVGQPPTNSKALEGPVEVLRKLVTCSPWESPSLLTVAQAGELVTPSEEFQIYKAFGLSLSGQDSSAKQVFQEKHASSRNPRNRNSAATALGRLAGKQGEYREAMGWYSSTVTGKEPMAIGACGWAFNAMQAGDSSELSKVGQALFELGAEQSTELAEFIEKTKADREAGLWRPTLEAANLVRVNRRHEDRVQAIIKIFR